MPDQQECSSSFWFWLWFWFWFWSDIFWSDPNKSILAYASMGTSVTIYPSFIKQSYGSQFFLAGLAGMVGISPLAQQTSSDPRNHPSNPGQKSQKHSHDALMKWRVWVFDILGIATFLQPSAGIGSKPQQLNSTFPNIDGHIPLPKIIIPHQQHNGLVPKSWALNAVKMRNGNTLRFWGIESKSQ